jgi:hypothetical protein
MSMAERARTIQTIEGPGDFACRVWQLSAEDFARVFPAPGQDIEWVGDLAGRLGDDAAAELFERMRGRPLEKGRISGIDGTLLFGLEDRREFFPPSKREIDWDPRHLNEAQQRLHAGGGTELPAGVILRHVQVVSAARNCAYPIFRTTEAEFDALFPDAGREFAFAEDVFARLGVAEAVTTLAQIWTRPVRKPALQGLHGTLVFGFHDRRDRTLSAPLNDAAFDALDR